MNKNSLTYIFTCCSLIIISLAAVSYVYVDIPSAVYFRSFRGTSVWKTLKIFTDLGRSELYLVPGIISYMVYRNRNAIYASGSLFLFGSVAISGIVVDILKVILGRARPNLYFREDLFGFTFFKIDSDFLSFPSGHSATALSAAVVFGILFPGYRYGFYLIGGTIAFSRIFLTYHYISDVLVGALLGILTSVLLYQSRFRNTITEPDMERNDADCQ